MSKEDIVFPWVIRALLCVFDVASFEAAVRRRVLWDQTPAGKRFAARQARYAR